MLVDFLLGRQGDLGFAPLGVRDLDFDVVKPGMADLQSARQRAVADGEVAATVGKDLAVGLGGHDTSVFHRPSVAPDHASLDHRGRRLAGGA